MKEKFDFSKIEDQKKAEALPKKERDKIEEEAHRKANVMIKQVEFRKKKNYGEADKIEFPKDVSNEYAQITYDEEFEKLTDEEQKELRNKEHQEALEINKEFNKPDSEIEVIEKELSPEVIEKIMEKVQDINKKGTAFTITPSHRLESIFENGILGTDAEYLSRMPIGMRKDKVNEVSKEVWAKYAKNRQSLIWFSIVGRKFEGAEKAFNSGETIKNLSKRKNISPERVKDIAIWLRDHADNRKLRNSEWFKVINSFTAIIFDISSFEERGTEGFLKEEESKTKNRSYSGSGSEFTTNNRIAPRLFKGVITIFPEDALSSMKKYFSKKKSGEDLYVPFMIWMETFCGPKKCLMKGLKGLYQKEMKRKES